MIMYKMEQIVMEDSSLYVKAAHLNLKPVGHISSVEEIFHHLHMLHLHMVHPEISQCQGIVADLTISLTNTNSPLVRPFMYADMVYDMDEGVISCRESTWPTSVFTADATLPLCMASLEDIKLTVPSTHSGPWCCKAIYLHFKVRESIREISKGGFKDRNVKCTYGLMTVA
jgi:hypothetical protein